MSLDLFRRAWRVVVDVSTAAQPDKALDVSTLDLEFKILSTIKPEPNKCTLTIWNLNEDHRAQLFKRNQPNPDPKKLVGVPVQIEAGYIGQTSVIFSGDLRQVSSMLVGGDWKTVLTGEDGGRAYREGRINTTFAKGTPLSAVLSQVAQAMGVGLGNTANFEAGAAIAGVGASLPHTMTLSGSAAKQLDRVVKSLGYTWSIQRGNLQLLKKGVPLDLGAIQLSPSSGLLDSPEAAIDASISLGNPQQFAAGAALKNAKQPKPKDPGILRARALMIPGLIAGRQVNLKSAAFHGTYMITEVEYVGQTFANNWHANLVLRLVV